MQTAATIGSWLCAQVVNRSAFLLGELSKTWSGARWTVKPAGVLFAAESCGLGGWRHQGGKEKSGVQEENAVALLWLSGILVIFLPNLARGGTSKIHLTSHISFITRQENKNRVCKLAQAIYSLTLSFTWFVSNALSNFSKVPYLYFYPSSILWHPIRWH